MAPTTPKQALNPWLLEMRAAAGDAEKAERALGLTPRSQSSAGQAGRPKPPGRARPTRLKAVP